ncbi:MAG: 3-hydroxyacyl-CoA dehydrogenase NAD-binding domain-containing protein, partial [Caballeronia sp.]
MVHRIDVENRDGIAVVSILNAPVNALSADVREDLFVALSSLQNDRSVLAVVITGAGRCFSAGADINEFRAAPGAFAAKRDPVEIGRLLDGFSKPVVAAINGPALGGGLELAMSCHWRVASRDAALGLPEISLGLLPGAGGTQRLPRLVGVKNALDMMLTGKKVVGSEAREIGLVDAVTEGSVVDAAVSFIYEAFASRKVPNGASTVVLSGLGDAYRRMIDDARARAMGMKAKRFAAEKIIDCTLSAIQLAFPEGLALERKAFEECLSSQEAGALQHGFFASRAAGRADRDRAVPRGIQVVGVVGAGTMGQGIAMSFATAGLTVRIVDISEERAQRAANAIRAEYQRQVERGRLRQVEAASCIARLSAFSSIDAVSSCDLVVEAVFEDLEVKLDMSAKLGKVCREGAIIASNTSTLDINRLAEASGRPQDFLGLHFFSPANVMRLVEVIRGEKTSPDAIATVVGVVRSMNKVPVVCEVCWGFVGNRMLE